MSSCVPLHRQIDRLAAGHAEGADGLRQHVDQPQADGGRGGQLRIARQQLKRQRLQRIAHQQRRRLIIGLVAGRPAAPQIVVVHRRQVIVHQRVHVHEFDGAGRRLDLVFRQAQRARGGEQQRRPDALAAAQNAVAHRLVQARRVRRRVQEAARPGVLHAQPPGFELRAEFARVRRLTLRAAAPVGGVVHALGPSSDSRLTRSPGSRA